MAKPKGGDHLLSWFYQLSDTRSYSDGMPQPITFTEIEAWSRLSRTRLKPHHIEALTMLDAAYRSEMAEAITYSNERRRREQGKK